MGEMKSEWGDIGTAGRTHWIGSASNLALPLEYH